MSGLFIAFEGGDGAGKTTQARLLETKLRQAGHCPLMLREPGTTDLGEYLRDYLASGQSLRSSIAELLLFQAARAELVADRIRPSLDAGGIVIVDRFAGSSLAYQGYGRGMDLDRIRRLNDFATGGLYPRLTLLLDIDPERGLRRVQGRQLQLDSSPLPSEPADNFEAEGLAFHRQVRCGFLKLAGQHSGTWQLIDGSRGVDAVAADVWRAAQPLLPEKKPAAAAP